MNEKTERLRALFLEVADGDTVTERQREGPGTLRRDRPVDERLRPIIDRMRAQFEFESALDTEEYLRVIVGFYDGEPDRVIADALGLDPSAVFEARMDLQLVHPEDWPLPIDRSTFKRRYPESTPADEIAADLDVPGPTVDRARRVLATTDTIRRTNGRYPDQFSEIVADGDLSTRLARDARESGLRDATEDMENDLPM